MDAAAPPDYPLAEVAGVAPPAPRWFTDALAQAPERFEVEGAGVPIEVLAWGERSAPGLLLLHGNGAHAHWWSFIAPLLADRFRVVAPSWSGMGGSGWRERYTLDGYVTELRDIAAATGLLGKPVKPFVVAHSFGGFPTMASADIDGHLWRGVMIVDTPLMSREMRAERGPSPFRTRDPAVVRRFDSIAAALARYRLIPPQPCEDLFVLDHIARTSVRTLADGSLTWSFDPARFVNYEPGDPANHLKRARCPVVLLRGERSMLVTPQVADYMAGLAPAGSLCLSMAGAHHHVMLDDALGFTAIVRRVAQVQ